jgi:hypothetical protein
MSQSTSSYGRVAGNIALIPERIIKLGPQLSKVNSFPRCLAQRDHGTASDYQHVAGARFLK